MKIKVYSTVMVTMAQYANEVTAGLLLLGLLSVLAIGLLLALIFTQIRRNRPMPSPRSGAPAPARPRYRPSVFDHACRWLAVKSNNVSAVQSALGLHNPVPCSWGEGLSRVAEQWLFISPPVKGWILVIGQSLPDPSEDVDECFHFVLKLSRALGHVQFYSVNRPVNHHAWVRAEGGRVRRAYAWAGETLWHQGQVTKAELDLALNCYGYGERPADLTVGEALTSNSEKVILLAARWSFDPTAVDERVFQAGLGVAGRLIQSKPH